MYIIQYNKDGLIESTLIMHVEHNYTCMELNKNLMLEK